MDWREESRGEFAVGVEEVVTRELVKAFAHRDGACSRWCALRDGQEKRGEDEIATRTGKGAINNIVYESAKARKSVLIIE